MKVGDIVMYRGRRYVLGGYSRMSSVDTQYVHLKDAETGERIMVPLDEVQPAPKAND